MQDCTSFSNAQYMHKICTRLYLFPQCAIYAQDCPYFLDVQYMRKIVLLFLNAHCPRLYFFSSMRIAQDCTYFPNAQFMHKICARLYLFPQCAIYAQNLHKIVLLSPMHIICARFAQDCTYFLNAQDLDKINVLHSQVRNICTRFAQDCTSFSNAQYMCKICTRLYLFPQCARFGQD